MNIFPFFYYIITYKYYYLTITNFCRKIYNTQSKLTTSLLRYTNLLPANSLSIEHCPFLLEQIYSSTKQIIFLRILSHIFFFNQLLEKWNNKRTYVKIKNKK
jgi:hypothetical protein